MTEDNLLSQLRATASASSSSSSSSSNSSNSSSSSCGGGGSSSGGDGAAAGRRLVFAGDDTWQQLAPAAFARAWPYPSFNVKDLHTVDDGVWQVRLIACCCVRVVACVVACVVRVCRCGCAVRPGRSAGLAATCQQQHLPPCSNQRPRRAQQQHVLPLLRERPPSWDALVGHYLGADHAGHSHGASSAQMAAKLAQMDAQVATVIGVLTKGGRRADTGSRAGTGGQLRAGGLMGGWIGLRVQRDSCLGSVPPTPFSPIPPTPTAPKT